LWMSQITTSDCRRAPPAIDAGTDSLPSGFSLPDSDLDGYARVIRGKSSGSPSPPDIGTLSTGAVDVGAYEFGILLTVSLGGNRLGAVTSAPDAPRSINCGSVCSQRFHRDATVTLTATPTSLSVFTRWEGDCSRCGGDRDCTVTLSSSISCTAVFSAAPRGGGGGGGCSAGGLPSSLLLLVPVLLLVRRLYNIYP